MIAGVELIRMCQKTTEFHFEDISTQIQNAFKQFPLHDSTQTPIAEAGKLLCV